MALKIVHPSPGQAVAPNFTATGTYEHPDSLVAMLIPETLGLKAYLGNVHPDPKIPGRWYCHFYRIADGKYGLAVGDPVHLAAAAPVWFRVKTKKAAKKATVKKKTGHGGFPPPSQPTANTSFYVSDIAYGTAPSCTAPFSANFMDANHQPHLGFPLPNDAGAPAGYWAFSFFGLPTNANPTTFHVNDSALPVHFDDEYPVTIIADGRAKHGKKSGKKKGKKK